MLKKFLETNGPWSQLVKLNNINLIQIHSESVFSLSDQIRITPFEVPHRGEFSETVGYKIHGPNKTALFDFPHSYILILMLKHQIKYCVYTKNMKTNHYFLYLKTQKLGIVLKFQTSH